MVLLVALLLSAAPAIAYQKHAGNPVGTQTERFEGDDAAMTETTLFVENDTIVGWYRTHQGKRSRIAYLWTKDPYDLDAHKMETDIPIGYAYPHAVRIGERTYDLFAVNLADDDLYRFRTTDNVHFTQLCGGPVVRGSVQNPAIVYDPESGSWNMLLEDNAQGSFRMRAYTSEDGCRWMDHGYALAGSSGNGWLARINSTHYVAIYGAFSGGAWRIASAAGTSPRDLTVHDPDVLRGISQAWEDTHLSDPDVLIIPEESRPYFDHAIYLYYTGDQKRTGVAVSDALLPATAAPSARQPSEEQRWWARAAARMRAWAWRIMG